MEQGDIYEIDMVMNYGLLKVMNMKKSFMKSH